MEYTTGCSYGNFGGNCVGLHCFWFSYADSENREQQRTDKRQAVYGIAGKNE